jgi:uncharacterized protein YbbC (DUF1343 family)
MSSNARIMVLNGIDRLISAPEAYSRFKKIGLVSNSKAVTAGFKINLRALAEAGFDVRFIFSPEHGYFANVRDGDYISDAEHPELKTPILSLFTEGHSRNSIVEALEGGGADAIVFDIQDAGVRFYTYIHALGLALSAAETLGIPLLVLDRINPAGASIVEGGLPRPGYISELCPFAIPVRYGLTIGELANYLAGAIYKNADLTVVRLSEQYSRNMIFTGAGLKWNAPSPAMVSPDTALFYPGTCLFEGTNLSEGRGTETPFQTIGAPFLNAGQAAENFRSNLKELGIEEFNFISVGAKAFTPASSKYENTLCEGLKLGFEGGAPREFRALLFGVLLLKTIYDAHRGDLKFLFSEKSRKFFIDRLCGGPELRETLIGGSIGDVYKLYLKWAEESRAFSLAAEGAKLY